MFFKLFLMFSLVPVIELYILMKVGSYLGIIPTMALILLTGAWGAWLAKAQGLQVLAEINRAGHEGRVPAPELIQGLMILIGAITLLTPGIVTDLIGLSFLFPISRQFYLRIIGEYLAQKIRSGQWRVQYHHYDQGPF